MAKDLRTLKITHADGLRAQLVRLGLPAEPKKAEGESLVCVELSMPLSDAQRLGKFLYEWLEISVSNASLTRSCPPAPGS